MFILPLIRPQNTKFDEQQSVCHSTAYTIHKVGEIVSVKVYRYVLILKKLNCAQHHSPKQSE